MNTENLPKPNEVWQRKLGNWPHDRVNPFNGPPERGTVTDCKINNEGVLWVKYYSFPIMSSYPINDFLDKFEPTGIMRNRFYSIFRNWLGSDDGW